MLVDLLNDYGPSISILFVVFIEAAGVFWFYGVSRFSDDIEKMLGFRPGIFWRVCWSYISPLFLLVNPTLFRPGRFFVERAVSTGEFETLKIFR